MLTANYRQADKNPAYSSHPVGKITKPLPVKLIVGLIYRQASLKDRALGSLKKFFGEIDFLSRPLNFNYTEYYYPEFGRPLKRIFMSFRRLFREDSLSAIKHITNKLEGQFSLNGKRRINIDPGCLSPGKLVLATTKDNCHRVYLGRGIFAEVTLFYQAGTFRPWPWTYPDYQSKQYLDIFNTIRKTYISANTRDDETTVSKIISRRKTAGKS